ncbi:MAG: hypothetical protein IJ470_03680 [Clostridia bacterium]|nr:hypothetical protein [Clostridia bacterium]
MNTVILILILLIAWLISCGGSACIGFFAAEKLRKIPRARAEPDPPAEDEIRKQEKFKREYENFLNYTGKPQDELI